MEDDNKEDSPDLAESRAKLERLKVDRSPSGSVKSPKKRTLKETIPYMQQYAPEEDNSTPVTPSSVTPSSVTPSSVTPSSVTPSSVTPSPVTPPIQTPSEQYQEHPELPEDSIEPWDPGVIDPSWLERTAHEGTETNGRSIDQKLAEARAADAKIPVSTSLSRPVIAGIKVDDPDLVEAIDDLVAEEPALQKQVVSPVIQPVAPPVATLEPIETPAPVKTPQSETNEPDYTPGQVQSLPIPEESAPELVAEPEPIAAPVKPTSSDSQPIYMLPPKVIIPAGQGVKVASPRRISRLDMKAVKPVESAVQPTPAENQEEDEISFADPVEKKERPIGTTIGLEFVEPVKVDSSRARRPKDRTRAVPDTVARHEARFARAAGAASKPECFTISYLYETKQESRESLDVELALRGAGYYVEKTDNAINAFSNCLNEDTVSLFVELGEDPEEAMQAVNGINTGKANESIARDLEVIVLGNPEVIENNRAILESYQKKGIIECFAPTDMIVQSVASYKPRRVLETIIFQTALGKLPGSDRVEPLNDVVRLLQKIFRKMDYHVIPANSNERTLSYCARSGAKLLFVELGQYTQRIEELLTGLAAQKKEGKIHPSVGVVVFGAKEAIAAHEDYLKQQRKQGRILQFGSLRKLAAVAEDYAIDRGYVWSRVYANQLWKERKVEQQIAVQSKIVLLSAYEETDKGWVPKNAVVRDYIAYLREQSEKRKAKGKKGIVFTSTNDADDALYDCMMAPNLAEVYIELDDSNGGFDALETAEEIMGLKQEGLIKNNVMVYVHGTSEILEKYGETIQELKEKKAISMDMATEWLCLRQEYEKDNLADEVL